MRVLPDELKKRRRRGKSSGRSSLAVQVAQKEREIEGGWGEMSINDETADVMLMVG